jgi:hypothetical protein
LAKKLDERLEAWDKKLNDFNLQMAGEVAGAPDGEAKIVALRKAEAFVSANFIAPLPALVADFEAGVVQKGDDFSTKLDSLKALRQNPPATWQQYLDNLEAALPLTDFDPVEFDLASERAESERFMLKLAENAAALKAGLEARIAKVNDLLLEHDNAATTPDRRFEALREAGKALFGEDFVQVPRFSLAASQGNEWQTALAARAQVLGHQIAKGDDHPVDTWFYGAARVREKLAHFENAMVLAEGFKPMMAAVELLPAQFPFRNWEPDPAGNPGVTAPEPWLGLEWPSAYKVNEEKVLYTAAYAKPFSPAEAQCGLLLDEWTEVVPSRTETTGLTFHYDRPNTEPPQAWLLAMAPTFGKQWSWDGLVQALHETLDLAKQRAVEPAQVEATPLGVFSPATVFPVAARAITPSLNLNIVNQLAVSF